MLSNACISTNIAPFGGAQIQVRKIFPTCRFFPHYSTCPICHSRLVRAYEQLCIDLPRAPADDCAGAEDDDETRECYEFASWVGVSFHGMEDRCWEGHILVSGKAGRCLPKIVEAF